MKRGLTMLMGMALLASSCSNAGEGAYVGGQFGHVIGSAIGGITGGGRGHHVGSLIGTVGGAVAGAAIGSATEKAHEREYEEHMQARQQTAMNSQKGYDDSGFDPEGRGDDRIVFGDAPAGSCLRQAEAPLIIRHAVIEETVKDGVLTRGEECAVKFEIFNMSDHTVFNVRPVVEDVTGNKHVKVSPNLLIESIGPFQGVRYTATILADSRLKDGTIEVMVGVTQDLQEVASQTRRFTVPTAKRGR